MRNCLQRAATLAALVCAATTVQPARAIDWDDAGNSASKLWSDNGNWNPDGSPANQNVNIGNLANAANDMTLFDGGYQITGLTVTNGADVVNSTDSGATNDFELIVNGDTSVSGSGSSIIIFGGDPDGLDTNNLTIGSGGSVILNSTTAQGTAVVEVDGDSGTGLLDIDGGTLIGTGRVDLEATPGVATTLLTNNGTITANTAPTFIGLAPAAGTLRLNATSANARFDWDGTGTTATILSHTININGNQTLDVDISTGTDGYGGTMNLYTGSTLDMEFGWELDAGVINANTPAFGLIIIGQDPFPGPGATIAGADWSMTGGTVNIDDTWDTLILQSNVNATGGTWNVAGKLQVDGTATFGAGTDLAPSGNGAQLVVNGSATISQTSFNWDGFLTTEVNDGASLTINSTNIDTAVDGYDGTLNINGGTVTVGNAWELEVATVNMDTSNSDSDLSGSAITVNSSAATINVTGSGASEADINAELIVDAALDVNIDPGTTLDLATNSVNVTGTTWDGGAGSRLRNGAATINAATTYNLPGGDIDLDDGNDTLNAQLTINADAIDTSSPATDGVDGTLTINNAGELAVNLTGDVPWRMDGTLNYNGDAISGVFISGASPVDFTATSELNVNGEGAISSRAFFRGVVNINDAPEDLELLGGSTVAGNTNEIDGGTINGPGQLAIDSGQSLRGHGTINAPIRGDGSTSQLIAADGTLDVNGMLVSMGTLGTSGAAAVLDINAFNTNATNIVRLAGGRIQGGLITNDGANGINGFGEVASRVNNNSRIDAEGGNLVLSNATSLWDGTSNTGSLNAISGNLELIDNAAYLFDGTVSVSNGREVFANGFELEFEPASTLSMAGGAYRSTNATDLGGNVDATAGVSTLRISGSTVFENNSQTTLTGDLQLDNVRTIVQAGAGFAGGGRLINLAGRPLILEDGANAAVEVDNQGVLDLGVAAAAQATVGNLNAGAGAEMNVDIAGTALSAIDTLAVSSIANLGGTLNLSLLGGFAPSLGQTFTILTALSRNGTFAAVNQPATMPAGLMFDVLYNPTNVQLSVVNSVAYTADFDMDGDVDADDLIQWEGDYGLNGDSDADSDGDSDGVDFLAWQQQNGSGVPPAAAAVGAVPEPATWALLAIGALALAGLRRRAGGVR
ncbi:MAG: hypothetical protein CMJ58_23395 [Planctomycetaceae bacterium]|nr:hypothetical protein [Planctomycetaceae bacterium]